VEDWRVWLLGLEGHRFEVLFEAGDDGIVNTHEVNGRRLLKRSPQIEEALISVVENGLREEDWRGLFYVMGWLGQEGFVPLYVGAAKREGRSHAISTNLLNMRTDRSFFAHWGDNIDYHIGDLSHEIFGFRGYRDPAPRDANWAKTLFESYDPPKLHTKIYLYVAPWRDNSRGPDGDAWTLVQVRNQLVQKFKHTLLNER
jgi:hypothetical protein